MNKDYKLLRSVIMFNHNNGQVQKNNATALSSATGIRYKKVSEMVVNMKNNGVIELHFGVAYPILDRFGRLKKVNNNSKPIVGVSKKTGNQIRFHNAYEAASFLKIKRSNIAACCNCYLGYKSAGGYEWRFEYE